MKQLFTIFTVLFLSIGLWSCGNDEELILNTPEIDLSDMVKVPLLIGGDISSSEMPLSRASSDDLIGIQVFWKSGSKWCPFSYGLFDHIEDLEVYLLKDYTYRIEATMIKNGKNVLESYSRDGVTCYSYYQYYSSYSGYFVCSIYPFHVDDKVKIVVSDNLIVRKSSSNDGTLNKLGSNMVSLIDGNADRYPEVNRLYGDVRDYDPKSNQPIVLEMKRVSFGTKVEVEGLDEGTLNFKLYNNEATLLDEQGVSNGYNSGDRIWQCSSVINAFDHSVGFFDKFTLKVEHKHSIVDITEDLGSVEVKLYRNNMNIIHIDLQASSRCNDSPNVWVESLDM